jgi:hypothetical protein
MSARIEADQLVPTSSTPPEDAGFYRHSQNVVGVTGSMVRIDPYTKELRRLPETQVIAQPNIPFLIMPGDGGANGCSFSGAAGAFTLSAAIIANIGTTLAGCYAYFSANFGGSTLPAGWYWTEFSSDTAGIVYSNTYTGGAPIRPTTKTPIGVDLTGRITATTNEVVGPTGFTLPSASLGKNGALDFIFSCAGSTAGTKIYRAAIGSTVVVSTGSTGSPVVDSIHRVACVDSTTEKMCGRTSATANTSISQPGGTYSTTSKVSVDTGVDTSLYISLQQNTNLATPVLLNFCAKATYGE